MSSENNAPPTITPRLTVPRPDTDAARSGGTSPSRHGEADGTSSNGSSKKGSSKGASAPATPRDGASAAVPPPPPPPPGPSAQAAPAQGTVDDDGMERASGESRVAVARAGAVKAAAAAI
ncbi:MAG: hypothetical protein ACTMID_03285, partial [Cellulosimicrobium funkei]